MEDKKEDILKKLGLTEGEAVFITLVAILIAIKNTFRNAFKKHPIIFITVLLSYSIGAGGVFYYYSSESNKNQQLIEYKQKINDKILELKSLEKQVVANQNDLEQLKLENQRLQTITNVNSQIVDDLFKVQEERNTKNVWNERFFSYLTGVLSSASFAGLCYLFLFVKRQIKYSRSNNGVEERTPPCPD